MNQYLIFTVGFLAQILFSARLLIQWIASEKAHRIMSPSIFWHLSIIASFVFCIYGWLRNDFVIILGQLVSYYIYIWNLKAKGEWKKIPRAMRHLFISLPVVLIAYFAANGQVVIDQLFKSANIPVWLMIWGIVGQFTFTLRFVYQWLYSRRVGESQLPLPFWGISALGSSMIILYAVLRYDPVLIIGQATGFVVYVRNIMIGLTPGKLQMKTDSRV